MTPRKKVTASAQTAPAPPSPVEEEISVPKKTREIIPKTTLPKKRKKIEFGKYKINAEEKALLSCVQFAGAINAVYNESVNEFYFMDKNERRVTCHSASLFPNIPRDKPYLIEDILGKPNETETIS